MVFYRSESNDEDYSPFIKASRQSSTPLGKSIKKILSENQDKDYSKMQITISTLDNLYSNFFNNKDKTPFFKNEEEEFLSIINFTLYSKLAKPIHDQLKKEKNIKKFFKRNFYQEQLKEAINNSENILFLEEINTWDENSLILVKKIIEHGEKVYPLIGKAKIVITFSENAVISEEKKKLINYIFLCGRMKIIGAEPFTTDDLLYFIETNSGLSPQQIEEHEILDFIKQYSEDNIEDIPLIIEEINEIVTDNNLNFTKGKILYEALSDKLNSSNLSSEKSEEILEYASLLGNTFSRREIYLISNLNLDEFSNLVNKVIDIKILKESTEENYAFATSFFQELFKTKALSKSNEYYKNLEKIIGSLYPSNYLRRAMYLSRVENKTLETQVLLILSALSDLRNNLELHFEINENLSIQNKKIINQFVEVYGYLSENNYQSAITLLKIVDGQVGDFRIKAEIAILLALCYSKNISSNNRIIAEEMLEKHIKKSELKEYYPDIFERLGMRLLIVYVHVGKLEKASELYEDLLTMFSKYDQTNRNIEIKKFTLFRISNAILPPEISLEYNKQASEFFFENLGYPGGLIHYYNSLTNFSASQIVNGHYLEAFQTCLNIKDLISTHPNVIFPRQHIWENNYCLSGYLSKQINSNDVIKRINLLISDLPINAERLFLVSNLSIFYALSDDFDSAKNILLEESKIQNTLKNDDIEGKYDARFNYNYAVYTYLSGDKKLGIEKIKHHINVISKSTDIEKNDELKRARAIENKMINENILCSGQDWLTILTKSTSIEEPFTNKDANHYKTLGFLFTSLSNWDI